MTSERYQSYLEALAQVERIDSEGDGAQATEELRELVQDVFLCREPAEVGALLEQVAVASTQLSAGGRLSRDGSIHLLNAAIACGPNHPSLGWPAAPSLVAG